MTVQYVGMDVDKQKIVLARLGAGRDSCAVEQVIANTPSAVKKYFTPLLGGAVRGSPPGSLSLIARLAFQRHSRLRHRRSTLQPPFP